MKLSHILAGDRVTVSCELFPPKTGAAWERVDDVLRDTAALRPDFISVTYGAGGSTSKRTLELAARLQDTYRVPALAHLTCVSATREEVARRAEELRAAGIENILALRGDIPQDAPFPRAGQFRYANELVSCLRSLPGGEALCIGAACYPEGHVECPHFAADLDNLKRKVDAGVDFLTTQMFFDNDVLYRFLFRALRRGITVPVLAGIMPVISVRQIRRSCELSGTVMPPRLQGIADRFGDDPAAMRQAGIAYATEQILDLIAHGVNHIHIYTMNRPDVAAKIMDNLSAVLRPNGGD
ncbi:methylenetetrahydrofolate reductase [NAD(P)H] [uncultured Intestinimonas sp.]|uniref:methylenetetrahydrofolate reductase [NAD(P)H] n=1 Tax=uncultured Intestinimonas sp. TaxID=1689265 RepID=UPI0025CFEFC8|nr:methylenetetrahydrofolate reductase [NAD(P)H] [uncultured Intestinimonas sp.]